MSSAWSSIASWRKGHTPTTCDSGLVGNNGHYGAFRANKVVLCPGYSGQQHQHHPHHRCHGRHYVRGQRAVLYGTARATSL